MIIILFLVNFVQNLNEFNGVYKIKSALNSNSFLMINNSLILSNETSSLFNIIKICSNLYYIKLRKSNIFLSLYNNDIQLYKGKFKKKKIYLLWNLIKTKENHYLIKNEFYNKFIGISNFIVILNEYPINNNYSFDFLKLFEEVNVKQETSIIINKEPIDIIIKYIDLTDRTLNRTGINHIYKDKDNEELRYSVRSILKNIPWVRKIFILMPNEKIRFFKSSDEINEKIKYVKDKDLIGYDSANIQAFLLNLHKMENFGISKNFIYMDDDYFIGRPLKKYDFFYYDQKDNKYKPYIIASKFHEINKTDVLKKYFEMFKNKELINPHSFDGFILAILCTKKFYIDNSNFSLIETEHTHNAIPQNIDDLKEMFKTI